MGEQLSEYRWRERISGAELARRLGVSRGFISQYLNGKCGMGAKTAKRVSAITGIPIVELMGLEDGASR